VTSTAKGKVRVGSNGESGAPRRETVKDEMVAYLRQDREKLRSEWARTVTGDDRRWLGATPAEQESQSATICDTWVDCLDTLNYRRAEENSEWMARQAAQGLTSSEGILGAMLALRDAYWRSLSGRYLEEPDRLAAALKVFEPVANRILVMVTMAFGAEKERVLHLQQEAIRELSTPVLRVRDRLLILPIIGLIDTDRARQLTEQLLTAIRQFRAMVVVMDITGVGAVDSKVANHLIQTIEAARLLGTDVVVTGVSPAIAQTIVTVGVDLSRIQTVGDLQGGIELADRLLGYRVISDQPSATAVVSPSVV
jgi:rsbT co-antagonist protein RsbR